MKPGAGVLAAMSTEAHILVIVLAAAVILFIVHLVRSRQLRAKYSVLWFSIGLALAVLAIFPGLLVELSDLSLYRSNDLVRNRF